MKSFTKIGLVAMLSLVFTGCLDKYPDNTIPNKEAIQLVSDADQAAIGIYASYKSSALYSGYLTLLPDIQTDLVYAAEGLSNTYGDIWRWDILATNREIEAVYSTLYITIGRCNYFSESIVDSENTLIDDEQLDKLQDLKGEAYFARTLAYSELIKCFYKVYKPATAENELGVVPISSCYNPEHMIRSSLKDSYAFVISDLEKALDLMTLDEINNSPYITKSIVRALLARVYLYMQDWGKTYDCATQVIEDDYLQLSSAKIKYTSKLTYYQYIWKYDSASEIIWKVDFDTTSYGGALGRAFLNYDNISYKPGYVPASWALSPYDQNDLRSKSLSAQKTTGYVHSPIWPLFIRYHGNEDFIKLNIYHVDVPKIFRLSEQYLIRAETYCCLKEYTKAGKDITTLRSARYKIYGATVIGEGNWLETISEERIRELFTEGFRLHDLKRWHKDFEREPQSSTAEAANSLKIEADHPLSVWPVPRHELDAPGSELQPNDSNN